MLFEVPTAHCALPPLISSVLRIFHLDRKMSVCVFFKVIGYVSTNVCDLIVIIYSYDRLRLAGHAFKVD